MPIEEASKVTVPSEWVKVPEFNQLPATEKLLVGGAANVAELLISKSPVMFKVGSLVLAVTVTPLVLSPMYM